METRSKTKKRPLETQKEEKTGFVNFVPVHPGTGLPHMATAVMMTFREDGSVDAEKEMKYIENHRKSIKRFIENNKRVSNKCSRMMSGVIRHNMMVDLAHGKSFEEFLEVFDALPPNKKAFLM